MCKEQEEPASHIVSECTEYTKLHDRAAMTIHWVLCKKYGLSYTQKGYDNWVATVMQNDHVKLLWDLNVQTDKQTDEIWSQ